jgi:hypothetical protein
MQGDPVGCQHRGSAGQRVPAGSQHRLTIGQRVSQLVVRIGGQQDRVSQVWFSIELQQETESFSCQ